MPPHHSYIQKELFKCQSGVSLSIPNSSVHACMKARAYAYEYKDTRIVKLKVIRLMVLAIPGTIARRERTYERTSWRAPIYPYSFFMSMGLTLKEY